MAADPVAYQTAPAMSGVGAGMGIDQLYKNLEGFVRQYGNSDEASGQWVNSLDPQARAMWDQHITDLNAKKTDRKKTGQGIALGLLGAGAGSMVLGPMLSGAGLFGGSTPSAASIAGAAGMPELGMTAQTGLGIDAATAAGALGGVPTAGGTAGGLSSAGSMPGSVGKWAASNPGLVSLLGGALAAGGSTSGPGGPAGGGTFAPQPGLQMGSLQQRLMDQSAGLLTSMAQPQRRNSGLGRFGATGGLFAPSTYTPQAYQWGK